MSSVAREGLSLRMSSAFAPHARDVVEYPFLVAVLVIDVMGNGTSQPLLVLTEAAAAGHQQRDCF